MRFDEMEFQAPILRAVQEMGFEEMTPIQAEAIPVVMEGRDIIGQAQTGTGKTAAFGIPMLQMIDPKSKALQALILCPTRELAIQVAEEVKKYFGSKVFKTVIPRNVRLSEAPSHGKPVIAYDRLSRGAMAYNAVAEEFLKRGGNH